MKKQRKHYSPEAKVAILRRHLLEKVPISKLCDELGLQPTVFYRWQKEFFENGAAAFDQKARPDHSAHQARVGSIRLFGRPSMSSFSVMVPGADTPSHLVPQNRSSPILAACQRRARQI